MEMHIKTRKEHPCCFCGEVIPAGTVAWYYEGRHPKFDDDDCQIGVEFVRSWGHPLAMLCQVEEPFRSRCLAGVHEFEPGAEFDHFAGEHPVFVPTGRNICIHCGAVETINPPTL